jgi:valyl-tRNA synthetase
MNPNGTMNELAGDYAGMDRYECREGLVEELKQKKLIAAIEPYKHSVGHHDRCHTPIEPAISDQWFVKMKPLAEKAIAATQKGEVVFHPERWARVYLSWLENVRDWCISRQIWWGHRIPAWYCEECKRITVGRTDPTRCAHCGSAKLHQDEDVLDTWFSSSLWPFSTLGWPEKTPELAHYYPTSVLATDRSIIYFWVARMVMMGYATGNGKPFSHVYIHGTVMDELGRKMSKSLGNGIDPLEMTQQYGADAVRFSLMMLTAEGQDVRLAVNKFEMGRNFANKIWNAARFALMNLQPGDGLKPSQGSPLEDRWILSRLNATVDAVTDSLEEFQFNEAARRIYDFTWSEFCDWYIEIIKPRLKGEIPGQAEARIVLVRVLDAIMRLLHPFAPFVTEELWQHLRRQVSASEAFAGLREAFALPSLMVSAWPTADPSLRDAEVESAMSVLQGLIRGVRNIRSNMEIEERKPLRAVVSCPDERMRSRLAPHLSVLQKLAFLDGVELGVQVPKPRSSAVEVVETVQLFVPLEGVIDLDKERERLLTRIERAQEMLDVCDKKLGNEKFVKRAPPEVVEKERARRAELVFQIEKLRKNYEDLA